VNSVPTATELSQLSLKPKSELNRLSGTLDGTHQSRRRWFGRPSSPPESPSNFWKSCLSPTTRRRFQPIYGACFHKLSQDCAARATGKVRKKLPITDGMAKRVRYKEGKSKDTVGLSRMIFPFGDNPLDARPFLYQTALIDRIPG
jgi:hypothetical protein